MITDGIRANGLHSHHDFNLCFKHRDIGLPKKKTIRQTVAFKNGYYDFTALNGSPAWDERIVNYAFDVTADTPEELEEYVEAVLDWLCNIHDTDIYDDTMPDYHWHGSYETCYPTYDESGLAVELSVEFVCYPFKIANEPTVLSLTAGTHTVINRGMAVAPVVQSDAVAAVQIGNYVSSVPANVETRLRIDLERGENTVVITGDGTVRFAYYKEVI